MKNIVFIITLSLAAGIPSLITLKHSQNTKEEIKILPLTSYSLDEILSKKMSYQDILSIRTTYGKKYIEDFENFFTDNPECLKYLQGSDFLEKNTTQQDFNNFIFDLNISLNLKTEDLRDNYNTFNSLTDKNILQEQIFILLIIKMFMEPIYQHFKIINLVKNSEEDTIDSIPNFRTLYIKNNAYLF